tara:strand:+ start:15684 stop:17717 length:2034 start_codon:yes stop_codon:yes gene_type:complete
MDHQCSFTTHKAKKIGKNGEDTTKYFKQDHFCIECNKHYHHDIYLENAKKLQHAKETIKKSSQWKDIIVDSVFTEIHCVCVRIKNKTWDGEFCGYCNKRYDKDNNEITSSKCSCETENTCNMHHRKRCVNCNEMLYLNHFPNKAGNKPSAKLGNICIMCNKNKDTERKAYASKLNKKGRQQCSSCKEIKLHNEFGFRMTTGKRPRKMRNAQCIACDNGANTKYCPGCNTNKKLEDFHKDASNTSGIRSRCIECNKFSHSKKKADTSASHRNYLMHHVGGSDFEEEWKGDENICKAVFQANPLLHNMYPHINTFIAKTLEHHNTYDKKTFGNVITLSKDDVLELIEEQNNKCVFTDIPLQWTKYAPTQLMASIDRIDSSKPHTKENCQLTSCYMNNKKNNKTDKEFKESKEYEMYVNVVMCIYRKHISREVISLDTSYIDIYAGVNYGNHKCCKFSYSVFKAIGIRSFENQYNPTNYINRCLERYRSLDNKKFGSNGSTITKNELLDLIKNQNNKCKFSGVELQWLRDAPGLVKASIDRIDNDLPHTKENCQLVVMYMNIRRGALTVEEYKETNIYKKDIKKVTQFYNYHSTTEVQEVIEKVKHKKVQSVNKTIVVQKKLRTNLDKLVAVIDDVEKMSARDQERVEFIIGMLHNYIGHRIDHSMIKPQYKTMVNTLFK